jgi:hypothetical protein
MEFRQCPYDASPIDTEHVAGSTRLSCSTCGAAWEWHNTWLRRVLEPDRDAVRRARATAAQMAAATKGIRGRRTSCP